MASPTAVTLDPMARPNGLLSVLRPFPAGTDWQRGVDVLVGSVLSPDRVAPCATQSGEPQEPGSVERFLPVVIQQGVYCSALGNGSDLVVQYAGSAADATFAYALSSELVTGTATNNPSLTDSVAVTGTATSATEAICLLEEALEPLLYGRQGVIHVPLGHACDIGDTVYRDRYLNQAVWRTYAGNLVAIHGTGDTVYATGEVWGAWGRVDTVSYVDRAINRAQATADILAIAVFDPAVNISVNITSS